jgi:UDP-glucose 4-epimerase
MVEEMLADLSHAEPAWKIARLRYFNPVGAHESGLIGESPQGQPNNLMPMVSQVAVGRREKLLLYGNDYPTPDGTGIRDYIHVMDLAEGHAAALKYCQQNAGLFTANLGTGQGYSVLGVIQTFETVNQCRVPYQIVERRPGDIAQCWADSSFAKKNLGWQAKRDLKQMCADTWRWQQQNPQGFSNKKDNSLC